MQTIAAISDTVPKAKLTANITLFLFIVRALVNSYAEHIAEQLFVIKEFRSAD